MTTEQKHLKEHFLEPETRCDFYVSAERKAVWKALLDMLEVLIGVCEKYGFRYYVDGGTMLGAIRHKGFIPWDDDIDVVMFREDYDKLQEVLPRELPPHLFMQTELTDPEYTIPHLKIRDSSKSGIGLFYARRKMRFNMGIFLDVFPYDGIPEDKSAVRKHLRELGFFLHLRRNVIWHKFFTIFDFFKYLYAHALWMLLGNARLYRWQENLCRKYDYRKTGIGATCIMMFGIKPRNTIKPEWIKDFRKVPFEYLSVNVPIAVEEVLTNIYGDWHKLVRGASMHSELDLDASVDYKTKLITKYGYKVEWFK